MFSVSKKICSTIVVNFREHRRNKTKSNKKKHEEGQARKNIDQGGEKKIKVVNMPGKEIFRIGKIKKSSNFTTLTDSRFT
jgi:hypothetical protein